MIANPAEREERGEVPVILLRLLRSHLPYYYDFIKHFVLK